MIESADDTSDRLSTGKGQVPPYAGSLYIEVALDTGVRSGMRAATGSRDDTE